MEIKIEKQQREKKVATKGLMHIAWTMVRRVSNEEGKLKLNKQETTWNEWSRTSQDDGGQGKVNLTQQSWLGCENE